MPVVSTKPIEWVPGQPTPRKPILRGWVHAITAPLALAATIVLVVLAPTPGLKWASVVYMLSSLILFGVSAAYHLFYWTPPVERVLQRLDHANIFLLIAGTYTPITVALLSGGQRVFLLTFVWVGAIVGILASVFWPNAPRWFNTLIYVLLGWVAVWFLPALWQSGGPATVILIIVGGIFYTIGAVVYATKKPNPSPKWFGFHETFHVFTVLAWACQCVGVYLAVL